MSIKSQNGTPSPILESLRKDLKIYKDSIKEVAAEILSSGVSKYPIFVAHQHEVRLGEIILDKDDLGTDWTINASTLEEFVEKNVIQKNKKELFKKNYKDPKKQICLFVIVKEGANYVYIPY